MDGDWWLAPWSHRNHTCIAIRTSSVQCQIQIKWQQRYVLNQTWAHDYSIKQSLQNSMRFRLVFVLESENRYRLQCSRSADLWWLFSPQCMSMFPIHINKSYVFVSRESGFHLSHAVAASHRLFSSHTLLFLKLSWPVFSLFWTVCQTVCLLTVGEGEQLEMKSFMGSAI